MSVSGRFSTFSLPEMLQFLQEGNKTGLLTVRSRPEAAKNFSWYFIWLNQGRIVAAADRKDYHGLVTLIAQRKWIPEPELKRLVQQCPLRQPFGLHLKSQSLLSAEQIKLLFSVQIIRQICALFELTDGAFNFIRNVQLPYLEMTGISIPATDITLPGLRNLHNWSALESKLPLPTSTILRSNYGILPVKLNEQELKVWNLTDGKTTIDEMAIKLDRPIESIRRTAFCLTIAGLAEEIPMVVRSARAPETTTTSLPSQTFLERVRGFLQQKAEAKAN